MDLSNREIATTIWLFVLAAIAMAKSGARDSACALIKQTLRWKIITPIAVALAYVALCVFILYTLNIWTTKNIWTTMIWSILHILSTLTKHNQVYDDKEYLKKTFRKTITVTGIVTYILELHSFNLIIELITVPIITLIALINITCKDDKIRHPIFKMTSGLLSLIALALITRSAYLSYADPSNVFSFTTLRDICIPSLLALMYLPFTYCLAAIFAYESEFMRLNVFIKSKKLRRAAQWRAASEFLLNIRSLKRWTQTVMFNPIHSVQDLDKSFAEVRLAAKREANPPIIHGSQGWSPYEAKNFLADKGLHTDEYSHKTQQEWSSSGFLKIGDNVVQETIYFCISGTDSAATKLLISLTTNPIYGTDTAETQFINIAKTLVSKALKTQDAKLIVHRMGLESDFSQTTTDGVFEISRTKWSPDVKGGYILKASLTSMSHCDQSELYT